MAKEPSGPRAKADPSLLRSTVFRSLVGVFLIFIAARSAVLWWQHDQELLAEQRRTENLVHVLAEHLDRTLGPIEFAFNQLAAHSDRIGGPSAPRELWAPVLNATLSGLAGIGSLNVIDAEGMVTLSTNPVVTATSRRDRFLYRQLKEDPDRGLVIAPSAPSPNYSGLVVPFGRALRDREGRFIGMLAATFQPDRLRGFYEAIDVGPHGVIQLLHPDGYALFRQPLAGRTTSEPLADNVILKAWHAGSDRGFLRAPIEARGEPYLTAWRTLAGPALLVAVSIAQRDALASWHTDFLVVVAEAAGMALMLAIAGLWITASSRAHARIIGERDQAGAALRNSQAQFQAIMDHTPVLVFVKDPEGRYLFVNRAAARWTGAKRPPAIGMTTRDVMAKEGADDVERADRKVLATKTPLQRELTIETPTGRRTLLSVKFPLIDNAGSVSAIGTIVTDITDQKHAEDRLAQAQRMEAVGQLTGGVAHDFNNMLTAILLNADVLATQIQNDGLRQLAVAMRHAAEHGADLTRRLLAFGRRQTLEPQPTDINELLRDMEPLMQRTLGEHIEIAFLRGGDLWPATVDPGAAGKRGSQPRGQRPRRHARRRPPHHRDRQYGVRRGVRGQQPRHAGRALRHGRGRRYRRRHGAGRAGPRLRAVLHHQGGRQRDRARAEHGLWFRQAIRRPRAHLFRGRRGHGRAPLSAAIEGACGGERRPRPRRRPSCRWEPRRSCSSRTIRWCAPMPPPSSVRSATA